MRAQKLSRYRGKAHEAWRQNSSWQVRLTFWTTSKHARVLTDCLLERSLSVTTSALVGFALFAYSRTASVVKCASFSTPYHVGLSSEPFIVVHYGEGAFGSLGCRGRCFSGSSILPWGFGGLPSFQWCVGVVNGPGLVSFTGAWTGFGGFIGGDGVWWFR
jgi:hypothetical protein